MKKIQGTYTHMYRVFRAKIFHSIKILLSSKHAGEKTFWISTKLLESQISLSPSLSLSIFK